MTPPSTAGLDNLLSSSSEKASQRGSVWTATPSTPTTPTQQRAGEEEQYFARSNSAEQAGSGRTRALSEYTLDDYTPMHDSDLGAFKIIIERPATEGRPRTADQIPRVPTLEVKIPSYKLGTPRFSTRGTAFLRNSSYTTDDIRSSVFSPSYKELSTARSTLRANTNSRSQSYASTRPRCLRNEPILTMETPPIPSTPRISPRGPISIKMFDQLTFKPACDSRALVRYSAQGAVTAATPPRLVAEITSPSFLDYDLLSDFFLTFRSFMTASDLLEMLVTRLRWALEREDGIGMIVRVRAFVAIRHWILNYFMDDFVVDYNLRKSFCELVNSFVSELLQDPAVARNKLKILSELKKCWRRTCALYWDGPEFSADVEPNAPIAPGGIAGSRDPHLTPSFWEPQADGGPPQLEDMCEYDHGDGGYNFFADVSRAGHIDSILAQEHLARERTIDESEDPPLSPGSILSDEVVSCSFPTKSKTAQLGADHPLGTHPVPLSASSWYDNSTPVAPKPKGLNVKRQPNHAHKRSDSFSDSLRDGRDREPLQTIVYKSTELLMSLPYAGSLVRGNFLPPGHAFVDIVAPTTPAEITKQLGSPAPARSSPKGPSAMSGPGMKKLIGSVRRVLGTKSGNSPGISPTQGSFPNIPPLGVRSATMNRLPGTAIVPQARSQNDAEGRFPVRIDLLGAGIAEDFKNAVREDAEVDAERQRASESGGFRVTPGGSQPMYPSMRPSSTSEPTPVSNSRLSVSGITAGSQSIVIVDDTVPFESNVMPSTILQNPSTNASAGAYIPNADPTPPSTPPDRQIGSPRRSSRLLDRNSYSHNRSISLDRTPSLVNDNRDQSTIDRSLSYRRIAHPSGISYGKPHKSMSLRRYASYQSGFTKHMTERSFDATTVSDTADRFSTILAPAPSRMLRRRPGGDLRAVTKVEHLKSLPLRRTRSIGSIVTDSVKSSYMASVDSSTYGAEPSSHDFSQEHTGVFSLGVPTQHHLKPKISLISTHSSKPGMRPSFEVEAAKLAQIPDDADDDGGVESALLKLEGKFEEHRRSQLSAFGALQDASRDVITDGNGEAPKMVSEAGEERRKHRHKNVLETSIVGALPPLGEAAPKSIELVGELKPTVYQPAHVEVTVRSVQSLKSEESYPSIPILQRDLSDDDYDRMSRNHWRNTSILRDNSDEQQSRLQYRQESSHPSISVIDTTLNTAPVANTPNNRQSMNASFLESDSDGISDLSSELSLEIISRTEFTEDEPSSTFPPIRSGTVITEVALPAHPLRQPSSPSMTIGQALSLDPEPTGSPQLFTAQLEFQPHTMLPPTPEVTPTVPNAESMPFPERDKGPRDFASRLSNTISEASRKTSAHLPFILAFDSKVLAQQFTLIEKDALAEIDWKELIDMRWKNTSSVTRSWVDFLRTQEARGVEVVIARFNIMVKWAISECVLTRNLDERVQTVRKFIHIAAHCRRYRNYATMYQLTVALTSSDVARLNKTWSRVPATDLETLKELETLVQPTRNFHNLRAEMECGGIDSGCIPFVGIYTQDLLFNSQRPSQIASTPTTEPLVNFERCRTMAAIVKNLLRLLEASSLYKFQPIEGITERCLWMAALNDEDIRKCGEACE